MSTLITRGWRERHLHFGSPKFHRDDVNLSRIWSGSWIGCLLWDIVYAWQKKTGRRSIAQSAESTLLENTQTIIVVFLQGWHQIHSSAEFKINILPLLRRRTRKLKKNPKSVKGKKLPNAHALHCTYSTTGLRLLEVWS